MSTLRMVDRLRFIAAEAERMASALSTGSGNDPLVADVVSNWFGGARIRTGGDATRGGCWAYVSMPEGWTPRKSDERNWTYQETGTPHYWFDVWGVNDQEALKAAVASLIERVV
jgi:hypothetical protein